MCRPQTPPHSGLSATTRRSLRPRRLMNGAFCTPWSALARVHSREVLSGGVHRYTQRPTNKKRDARRTRAALALVRTHGTFAECAARRNAAPYSLHVITVLYARVALRPACVRVASRRVFHGARDAWDLHAAWTINNGSFDEPHRKYAYGMLARF